MIISRESWIQLIKKPSPASADGPAQSPTAGLNNVGSRVMFVPGATAVLLASTHVYLHQYVVCSRLISTGDDVVTETDHRLYGGAGAPGWGSRRTRGRSAENSFRCIGRRRFGSRRRQRSEFGWIFGHCEPAGCDVQVRLVSRSCRSSRALRHADHQPRCRTCHVGPRLRLLYASSSGLLSSSISLSVGRATAPSSSPERVSAQADPVNG